MLLLGALRLVAESNGLVDGCFGPVLAIVP